MPHDDFRRIDGITTFVICSRQGRRFRQRRLGRMIMTRFQAKSFLMTAFLTAAALTTLAAPALAQDASPAPWELKSDMGYAYGKDGSTLAYKMGTNNAGL